MTRSGLYGAVPLSHFLLQSRLLPGGQALDATCGNGNDTLLLARLVGAQGRVWALDTDAGALAATSALLREHGCAQQVTLLESGHERLGEVVSGELDAALFNLGYLPGGSRSGATKRETTLPALEAAASLLRSGGVLIVCLYTGHEGGEEEAAAVGQWAASLDPHRYNAWRMSQQNRSGKAPYLLLVEKA